ncbi:histidine kinase [Dactylosporangium aurantiacum]|uniref:Histidine kinase n=1 Tax=Dactylosporangium aurantiacum TaxID=35754 RepID=A0A9Q9IDP4_9ACTN|nr:DICT sensory domain-containing protein [Dactylosporangium aurantiacum]MDG6109561.1 DICT sensory domain-containing protein [Dactylosporangium aurantiacum]UWZ51283.1 histidine kinase [Dactylosporangium aurantiacum]
MPDLLQPRTRLAKRTLIVLSHAIEHMALAPAEDGPALVIALFQRRPYYERERAVYERIAARGAVAVVGLVDGPVEGAAGTGERPRGAPGGPVIARLDEHDDLASEWSVVVLTPRTGAVLIARDLERVDDAAQSLEGGRLFDGRVSFRRDDALHEALRLQKALAGALPEAAIAALDAVTDRVRELPAAPGESRLDASVQFLIDSLHREQADASTVRRRLDEARAAGDGHTDDLGAPAVQRWLGTTGTTASGTLPVALLAVRVVSPTGGLQRAGRRGVGPETVGVLRILQQARRPSDRSVRLDGDEYLLVMPSRTEAEVIELAHRVAAEIAALRHEFPLANVRAVCAVTVTRRRPLPVPALRDALAWAFAQGVAVATLPADTA